MSTTSSMLSASTPTPSSTPTPALLPLLLPHLLSFLRRTFHLSLVLPKQAFTVLTFLSHSAVITPLAYILAPVFTFLSILFSITLGTPYRFLTWLLESLFPLYVFCGVACITGGLLGFGGRILCMTVVKSVSEERMREKGNGYNYKETKKSGELDPDERSAKRRRVERDSRLGVKFEIDDDSYWSVRLSRSNGLIFTRNLKDGIVTQFMMTCDDL